MCALVWPVSYSHISQPILWLSFSTNAHICENWNWNVKMHWETSLVSLDSSRDLNMLSLQHFLHIGLYECAFQWQFFFNFDLCLGKKTYQKCPHFQCKWVLGGFCCTLNRINLKNDALNFEFAFIRARALQCEDPFWIALFLITDFCFSNSPYSVNFCKNITIIPKTIETSFFGCGKCFSISY